MNILGLHIFGHDTGASLATDKRLWAISEERLNRQKHSGLFPEHSIRYVLRAAGLAGINDVDAIVGMAHPDKKGVDRFEKTVRKVLDYSGSIYTISHHEAHAASTYYTSPFDDASIMVVDGLGSEAFAVGTQNKIPFMLRALNEKKRRRFHEVQSFFHGRGTDFSTISKQYTLPDYQNGLGLIYMATSVFLNFGDFGSGKVMGLAPYGGKDNSFYRKFCELVEGVALTKSEKNFVRHIEKFQKAFYPTIPVRTRQPLPDEIYTEIAYTVQDITEKYLIEIANHLYKISPSQNLCYAGGVGLNSVANKKILDNSPFENIFIQPASCDSGLALGCALYGAHAIMGKKQGTYRFKNAYLGCPYGEEKIIAAVNATRGIGYKKDSDIVKTTARLLADGKIIGWFEGASEIGPRALGHRSIICDPRDPNMKDKLNARVKHRESFRPFAPSVLLEKAFDYFDLACESPYMLLIAKVTEAMQQEVPAITHVDGTARVQTVTKDANGRYYELIEEFYRITGTPVILNTSFNIAGEPIVETPEDAIACFMSTEMDYLVIEDYLIEATEGKNLIGKPVADENIMTAQGIRNM
ncbi:MAG: carbamoyl transferase [Deltaproteobacteria bacterium]|nr:carbamoyl transferase [Candidatus Zymogenaceae bacterium]